MRLWLFIVGCYFENKAILHSNYLPLQPLKMIKASSIGASSHG